MNLFEAIKERYSYRGEFKPVPLGRDELTKILEAGLAAPSGCNAQTTYLIGIDDPEIIKAMSSILKKPKALGAQAGICVVTHAYPVYRDMQFNVQDYSAAIENMLLAITASGYASYWIEGEITANREVQKAIQKLLDIPEKYELVCYLPIGVPLSPGSRAVKKPFSERAFFNRFGA